MNVVTKSLAIFPGGRTATTVDTRGSHSYVRESRRVMRPNSAGNGLRATLSRCASVALIAWIATSLAGCVALLPRGQTATQGSWPDYESAQSAIERIVPHQSRRAELAASGLDPYNNPTITILNYSDIVQRFGVSGTVKREELNPGILECLQAGKACTGYAILVRSSVRKRTGGFWMDVLNFRRVTDVTGWTFNALILMIDDLVVYTLHGGQPRIHEREVSRNPLGPIQETLPSLLKR